MPSNRELYENTERNRHTFGPTGRPKTPNPRRDDDSYDVLDSERVPQTANRRSLRKPQSSFAEDDAEAGGYGGYTKKQINRMTLVERTALYSNTQCPNCLRYFGKKAAQRHIDACQDIVSKPKTLKEK